MKRHFAVLVTLILTYVSLAEARVPRTSSKKSETTKSKTKLKKKKKKKKTPTWKNVLDVSFNTDAKTSSDQTKGYNTQLWYFLTYNMSKNYTARLWVDVRKDLADSFEEKLNDTRVKFAHKPIKVTKKLSWSPGVQFVIPTSERSARDEELNLGVEVDNRVSFKVNEKLSFSYMPRMVKNFHEFETTRTDRTNSEYELIQFFSGGYNFTDNFYTSVLFIYSNTWSYSGTARDPGYLTNVELGYSLNKNLTLAMGTLTGGSIFDRQNGPDETLEFYDRDATTLYGRLVLSF